MTPTDGDIIAAVAAESAWMEELLIRLVEAPTVLGNEEPGQAIMAEAFADLGLEPRDVAMDAELLRAHPLASPFDWDVSGKRNVVATWDGEEAGRGRSLVLNGHIDVVSAEPVALWTSAPFRARREDDWLYGRGAGDMKSGLAAMLGAVRGLQRLGVRPSGPVELQSVVEEECTGNGALAAALAGPEADAAVVVEPFGNAITIAQVGVLWFHLHALGQPAHAGEAATGANAIDGIIACLPALRELEAELNAQPPAPYGDVDHPIYLNVGTIQGGDWPSIVPAECRLSCRIGLFPGDPVQPLLARIRERLAWVDVEEGGFACEGFSLPAGAPLVEALAAAHERRTGEPPDLIAATATTDARQFHFLGIPAACLGPYAERLHAADERVWLPSVEGAAQTLALFIRDWCGLSA